MERRTTVHDLLEAARSRLDRVHVHDVAAAIRHGAVLVDIRSEVQRRRDGEISHATRCPRNVLEWRVDPASDHADPELSADLRLRIILVCHEGYQSSLAAATLQDLGFENATDLIGGFLAWRAAGLPVEHPCGQSPGGRSTGPWSGETT
jgi:rhodanese-related sulfurtransferase